MQRSMRYSDQQRQERNRRIMIRNWIIVIVILAVLFGVYQLVRNANIRRDVVSTRLPCTADQNITVFGDNVLYYDGVSIHCLTPTGSIRWSFSVGANAQLSVSDTHIVAWCGSQLYILDKNGRPTYNENMASQVQFARIGSNYCAVVIGEDTQPQLLVKNMDGTQVDSEIEAFSGLMLLDVGFYGPSDTYMWTLCLDVYGVSINTVLNTFQVNKMNSGEVNLGEYLAYRVVFEDDRLRVFTTQQMYTYDYKAVQDMSRTMLVYGWELIDVSAPASRGPSNMLLAPTAQLSTGLAVKELRVLTDTVDRRYTLPTECVGAAIDRNTIYTVSADTLFRADVADQRFAAFSLKLPQGISATSVAGMTKNGYIIVLCNDQVYSVSLPR